MSNQTLRVSSQVYDDEMARINLWRAAILSGERIVFRFQYGNASSETLLAGRKPQVTTGATKCGVTTYDLVWQLPELECRLELLAYDDFPALEWVLHLTNTGKSDSPAISAVRAMWIDWRGETPQTVPVLHRANGSDEHADDFQYQSERMRDWRSPLQFKMDSGDSRGCMRHGRDGRSSNRWLPFFNLQTGGEGFVCAVGWSERWCAEFANHDDNHVTATAGLEYFDAVLHPGESMRAPRILFLYWHGEVIHGHNLLRGFLRRHIIPQIDGQPVTVPVCSGTWGGMATANHLALIDQIQQHRLQFDYYWIDAGWYGSGEKPCPNVFEGDWGITGNWQVNPYRHPNGLMPISRKLRETGMKFLLWIEPERAVQGTPVTLEHPEWFLSMTGAAPQEGESLLLNLGIPAARQWAIDTVSKLIVENGIDCYREDFNFFASLEALLSHDEPGRLGIAEQRFVTGFYEMWDELRRRHPNLLIDNCASGGRRIDFETMRRSLPLWRTDYNCFQGLQPNALQSHTMGLGYWGIPNSTNPMAPTYDTYHFRSGMSVGAVFCLDEFGMNSEALSDAKQMAWVRQMLEDTKAVRPYWDGDFYPLTQDTLASDAWMAWQLHRPDLDAGVVVIFRREESPLTTAEFQLKGLQGAYRFRDQDTAATWELPDGQALTAKLDQPRTCKIWFYAKS